MYRSKLILQENCQFLSSACAMPVYLLSSMAPPLTSLLHYEGLHMEGAVVQQIGWGEGCVRCVFFFFFQNFPAKSTIFSELPTVALRIPVLHSSCGSCNLHNHEQKWTIFLYLTFSLFFVVYLLIIVHFFSWTQEHLNWHFQSGYFMLL